VEKRKVAKISSNLERKMAADNTISKETLRTLNQIIQSGVLSSEALEQLENAVRFLQEHIPVKGKSASS
jgi:hypothetical protein